jgi:hypothetical protein
MPPKLAADLKGRRTGFAFVYGTPGGKERLGSELATSGIRPRIYVHQDDTVLPKAFSGGAVKYSSPDAAGRFQSRCGEIGRQLLESQQVPPERVAQRVLGYGNSAYLVAFPYNVPTATLTLLWSEGKADGIDWMPLLPRRKKK